MASTLKTGSRGDEVSSLQNMLNQQGYNLTVDGIYGDKTAAAVKQYQQANGLTVDGIVGTNTWGALNGGSGAASGTSTTYNPSYDFDDFMSGLQKASYTKLTDEQVRQQALNKYEPIYNQQVLSAEQAHDKTALALQQQLEALQPTYDKQRENTAQSFAQTRSNADRQALSRGMQRSSFNNATLSNIDIAGSRAQDDINSAQTRDENTINENKQLASTQLAQYLQQLQNDKALNLQAYEDAIRDKDYDRAFQALSYNNELEMALEQASRQQSQWSAEFAENQRQFNASLAASTAKSSSGSSSTKKSTTTTPTTDTTDADLAGLLSTPTTGALTFGTPTQTTTTTTKKKTLPGGAGGQFKALSQAQ